MRAYRIGMLETTPFCFGEMGGGIFTVRFMHRSNVIQIFGAGYWRKGKRIYEREAAKHNTQYQRMIRRLLDAYAERYAQPLTTRSTGPAGTGLVLDEHPWWRGG